MKKLIKKITAVFTAATVSVSALAAGLVCADEPVTYYRWNATYFNAGTGAGYTGSKDYPYMVYSTLGLKIYCNGTNSTVDGARGYVEITCTNNNVTMNPIIFRTASSSPRVVIPDLVGSIKGLDIVVEAYTSTIHNTFSANGSMRTIE